MPTQPPPPVVAVSSSVSTGVAAVAEKSTALSCVPSSIKAIVGADCTTDRNAGEASARSVIGVPDPAPQ